MVSPPSIPPALARLRDGTIVLVREQTRADRPLIAELFAGLSPRSRHLRFHAGTPPVLPRRHVDALAAVDGDRHVAVIAIRDARPIGAARYVRSRTVPTEAEIAVTVTDAFQARGLGRLLIETLTADAAARGLERLTFEILPENHAARTLARRLGGGDHALALRPGARERLAA